MKHNLMYVGRTCSKGKNFTSLSSPRVFFSSAVRREHGDE